MKMGIFKTTHKVTPEEKELQLGNLKRLKEDFNMTKAISITEGHDPFLFIYDESSKNFVAVQGPLDTFKLKNPFIVNFDQVKKVYLVAEEIMKKKSDDAFWQYNLYINIETAHPYVPNISHQMNNKPIAIKILGHGISSIPRGLGLKGRISSEEIKRASDRIEKFADEQNKDKTDDKYARGINEINNHLKHAYQISKVLEKA